MKLLKLNLKAVGPFSSAVLDLSAGQHGLHLIYGSNEAGKSSALRAISHLLFGFPHLSADNFVHPNEQLRVGATLRHSDGGELEILRRRGRGNTLRAADDSTAIPEEWRRRFLGDLNQQTFESLFGIDHERLSQAGEEIRTGKGVLGELLFAAGAGLAGLRRAQQTLQQGLDDLFKPRAQNPRINKVLTELDDAQKEWKRQQLTIEEWQERDGAYRDSLSNAERLREEIRKCRVEHGRLTRIKSAIPLNARRQQLAGELAKLGDFVRLRDGFGAEFRATQDKRTLAEHAIARARAAILEITASSKLIDPPRALLDASLQIEALQERLGAFEKAILDRANIENLQQTNEYAARRLLRELGRPTDLDQAESLRLRADEPAIIRGWARSSPSFEARPTRRGGRSLVMTNRSGRGRPSSASWNNRLTWMHSAAQCGKPAKRAILTRNLHRRAISWPAHKKMRPRPWLSTRDGTARPKSFGRLPFRWTPPWINSKADSWIYRDAGRRFPSGYRAKRSPSASARAACTPWHFSRICPVRKRFLQLAGGETMVGSLCWLHGLAVRRVRKKLRLFWLNSHRPAHSPRHTRRLSSTPTRWLTACAKTLTAWLARSSWRPL